MQISVDTAYENLANAIVLKAVDDYRKALKGVGYGRFSAEQVIEEVERFFRSHYFEFLTKVKGDYLIEQLKKEHEEKERSNHEGNISTSDTEPD